MIEITAVRLAAGDGHEHITDVMWKSAATTTALSPSGSIVDWLLVDGSNVAVVRNGAGETPVEVLRTSDGQRYLRARRNGAWTDELLALPRF